MHLQNVNVSTVTGMLVELHAELQSYFNLAPTIDFVKEKKCFGNDWFKPDYQHKLNKKDLIVNLN